ncbi:response regulator [Paenibacillus thalictri]|nr:response regulator [Paenibacillus thalictri]
MYRVLIVDDETSVRSGLRDCVDWAALGLELAGEAEDGEIALPLVAARSIHIVLTDVRMPHMDGIALAEKLRETHPSVKIIMISGFGDIDYLKSALKLDAIDYILKPVRLQELQEVLARVVLLLQEEDEARHNRLAQQMKLNQSIPLLRERYLTTLVVDGIRSHESLEEKFQLLNIDLPVQAARLGVFVIRIDDYAAALAGMPEREKQLLSFALLNISEDIVKAAYCGHTFETKPGEYVGLVHFSADHEEEQLFTTIEECRNQMNRLLKINVTIGVGCTVRDWVSLPEAYRTAAEAAEHRWFLGKNQIITMDSLAAVPGPHQQTVQLDVRSCISVLKAPNWETVERYVSEAFGKGHGAAPVQHGRNLCMYMIIACSELLLELDASAGTVQTSERQLMNRLSGIETVAELKLLLLQHVRLAYDVVADKREHKTRNVVTLIKSYIDEHFAKDLTIAEIAAAVYLTPTYICLLFKQETGLTINDYVIEARLRKAKQLLADPSYKTYDICYAVGYKDPSYFSKLFKKHTGLTPSEFREMPV